MDKSVFINTVLRPIVTIEHLLLNNVHYQYKYNVS